MRTTVFLGQLGLFGWKDMPDCVSQPDRHRWCCWRRRCSAPRRPTRLGPPPHGLAGRVRPVLRRGRDDRHVHHLHAGGHGAHRGPADAVLPAGLAAAGCWPRRLLLRRVLAPRLTAAKGRGAGRAAVRLVCALPGRCCLFQHYFVGPVYTIYQVKKRLLTSGEAVTEGD